MSPSARRGLLLLLLAISLIAIQGCSASRVKAVTDSSFQKDALESKLPVLVDYWATWCGPCRIMAPVIEELAREYSGRIKVFKMDVDKNPETSGRYSIRSIPTLLLYKKGRLLNQFVGVIAKDDLKRQIEDALARSEKPDLILHLNGESFVREVLKSKIPVLVDIWAPWCGPCRILAPIIEDLSWEYEGRLKVTKVNMDENKDIALKYRVQGIPYVLLFKDGRPIRQWMGVRPRSEYMAAIERVVPAAAPKAVPTIAKVVPETR